MYYSSVLQWWFKRNNSILANAAFITLRWHYPSYDEVNMSGYGCLCSDDAATLSKINRAHWSAWQGWLARFFRMHWKLIINLFHRGCLPSLKWKKKMSSAGRSMAPMATLGPSSLLDINRALWASRPASATTCIHVKILFGKHGQMKIHIRPQRGIQFSCKCTKLCLKFVQSVLFAILC